jgi:hypothetical protein
MLENLRFGHWAGTGAHPGALTTISGVVGDGMSTPALDQMIHQHELSHYAVGQAIFPARRPHKPRVRIDAWRRLDPGHPGVPVAARAASKQGL